VRHPIFWLFPSYDNVSVFVELIRIGFIIGDIIRDFQNQTLQEEWDKFRTSILIRRNERSRSIIETQQALQQERETIATAAAQRHATLDEAIDSLNAKFADEAIALEYDTAALVQKFQTPESVAGSHYDIMKDSKPLPCLGQRAHWIDCHKKYSTDPRPCNAYLTELEKCVMNTISK
jgi:K+-sensing histidine kinase KdpD